MAGHAAPAGAAGAGVRAGTVGRHWLLPVMVGLLMGSLAWRLQPVTAGWEIPLPVLYQRVAPTVVFISADPGA